MKAVIIVLGYEPTTLMLVSSLKRATFRQAQYTWLVVLPTTRYRRRKERCVRARVRASSSAIEFVGQIRTLCMRARARRRMIERTTTTRRARVFPPEIHSTRGPRNAASCWRWHALATWLCTLALAGRQVAACCVRRGCCCSVFRKRPHCAQSLPGTRWAT